MQHLKVCVKLALSGNDILGNSLANGLSVQILKKLEALGVVIIGRNEGQRLVACLKSIDPQVKTIYVDSGSTDDSVIHAQSSGARVVLLDMTKTFTAARARNAGFASLLASSPSIEYVQFIDGDCMLHPDWLGLALEFLRSNAQVGVVCGRRRELRPEDTVYNALCDEEWNSPVGEAKACGGDAMMVVRAFSQAGGYLDDLIAGEEPELCLRIRRSGWRVWRINEEMTLHDAAIVRFSQWWTRTKRAGHAFAQGAFVHGKSTEKHWVRETRSALLWGLFIPTLALAMVVLGNAAISTIIFLAYPLQMFRISRALRGNFRWRMTQSYFLVLGKFAELQGVLKFYFDRWRKTDSRLIEYK
jgi:glycosyltransferase involved in cell wall biosynthesis